MTRIVNTALTTAALLVTVATAAQANCITGSKGSSRSTLNALTRPAFASTGTPLANESASIVGLWTVTFLIGDGPGLYDQGFEQWHADGTEITIDVAVPPAAGNVCLGVWEQAGARKVKLHHVGWNWDTSTNPAALAGVFVLDMTVTLSTDGKTFTGRYVTDSYDNDGNVIPAFHGEGIVSGTRIGVN